jgi:ankyrin repeat protein
LDDSSIHDVHTWKLIGGLKSAKIDTEWYNALLVYDCKSLMKQLCKNGSLVVQIGYKGRTVLLAAARQGCTPLVNQVMNLFKDDAGHFITGNDRIKISISPLHDLFQAEDFGTKLRAVEIMQQFIGSEIILHNMNAFYGNKFYWSSPSSVNALTGDDVERRTIAYEGNQLKDGGQLGIPMDSFIPHPKTDMRNNLASKNNTHLEDCQCSIHRLDGNFKSLPFKKIGLVSLTPRSGNDEYIDVAKADALAKIRDIIDKLLEIKNFEALMGQYSKHKEYNFDEECTEFIFHFACQSVPSKAKKSQDRTLSGTAEDFLWSFFEELGNEDQKILHRSEEDKILQSLYEIKNWQGKTPCHAALSGSASGFRNLLDILRDTNDPMTFKLFLNARDARGWTPLHRVVAMVSEQNCLSHQRFILLLLKNEKVNVNGKLPISDATPLHLAILHNLPQVVNLLLESSKGDLNASLRRKIRFSSTTQPSRWSSNYWSPLQLAAIMGHHGVVEALLKKVCIWTH